MAGVNSGERFKYGVVAFAAHSKIEVSEPSAANIALASATQSVFDALWEVQKEVAVIVSQWQITKALRRYFHILPNLSVEQPADGSSLDEKAVWEEAKKVFAENYVTHVIVLGQPHFYLSRLKKMVKQDGYHLVQYKEGRKPFAQ